MHVQVKSTLKSAAFSDEVEDEEGSVVYPKKALAEFLEILATDNGPNDPWFNIAGTSGHDIELGGEISFWVDAREGVDLDQNGDPDHELAAERAMERLQTAGYDAKRVHVQAKHLDNTPGALLAFVEEVSGRGHHILEITIGAQEPDGVPVQIFTAKASD